MADDPDDVEGRDEALDGEEPTRDVSDLDINEDGVIDPVEAAVSAIEDEVEEDAGVASSDQAEVEVQPPSAAAAGVGTSVQLAQPKRPWISRFIPRTRRERQIQALQAGYTEMVDMMRNISTHLERQAQVHDNLLGALEHFPDAVDSLRSVGKATEQQTEMLGLVKERLESNASHEEQVVDSMNRFNNTLTMMDETSKTTSDTIGSLVDRSRESEESLRAMLERSERRTTMLLGLLGLLTIGAMASALYFGVSDKKVDLSKWFGAAEASAGEHAETDAHAVSHEKVKPTAVEADASADKTEKKDTSDDKTSKTKASAGKSHSKTSSSKKSEKKDDATKKESSKKSSSKTSSTKRSSGSKSDTSKSVKEVKDVDPKVADAAKETDVTAEDAATSSSKAAKDRGDVAAPELDEDLAQDGKSIIKKVVSVLAGSEDKNDPPTVNIEPVKE